jgi:cytochrome c oxidase cbb3-type subunit 3/ubiquinol-cytochrome c reductase cytochrome c subunit
MKFAHRTITLLIVNAAIVVCPGCRSMPGYPKAGDEAARPDQVTDFQTLYKQNCSGCHGEDGREGAAIALNNPAYLAYAGAENLRAMTAQGMRGTLMPAFAQSGGGMLTDQQVDALVQGMLQTWGKPQEFAGLKLPPYASAAGDATNGQRAYAVACARCHGAEGTGTQNTTQAGAMQHSIVDASYLALVSDQSLRSIVVAGHPEKSAPDWRAYVAGRALTEPEINDIVAWIGAHRAAASAQPGNEAGKAGKEAR